jgi:hypothetical protein
MVETDSGSLRYGEFQILGNGDVAMLAPDSTSSVRTNLASIATMTRQTAPLAGCDHAAFDALAGNASCPLSCSAGDTCSAFNGSEACCPTDHPFFCPNLDACFAQQSDRDTACANAFYGDPKLGCTNGQDSLSIFPLTGHYCAPACNGSGSTCPVDPINHIQGTCNQRFTEGSGNTEPTACSLGCTDPGVTGGSCPNGMTCGAQTGGGNVCVWASS